MRVSFRGIEAAWNPYRDPGVATGWLESSGGFVLSIFQSFVARVTVNRQYHPFEHFHIQGERAGLSWTGPWGAGPMHLLDPDKQEPVLMDAGSREYADSVKDYAELLYRSVHENGEVFCPPEDNVHSLAAVKAMELSARRGGAIVEVAETL